MSALTDVPAIPAVYEELSIGAAPVGFQRMPAGHVRTRYRFLDGPCLYTLDGTAPVGGGGAHIGFPAYDGDTDWFDAHEADRFRAVRRGATNGIVRCIHYVRG